MVLFIVKMFTLHSLFLAFFVGAQSFWSLHTNCMKYFHIVWRVWLYVWVENSIQLLKIVGNLIFIGNFRTRAKK